VNLNRATINGFVDAFGEKSADWINKVLTVETEKVKVGGKTVFEKQDDANDYTVIVKKGTTVDAPDESVEDLPF